MTWNWQHDDWPHFRFDARKLAEAEATFLHQGGVVIGGAKHLTTDEQTTLTIDIMSNEGIKTSAIEGEILDRESLQSSLRRQFGLTTDSRRARPAEQGIANLLTDLYRTYDEPLDHETLFRWHEQLTQGRQDLDVIGGYRSHDEPMQIVSGPIHNPKVHFEAPPSARLVDEMTGFIDWFNASRSPGENTAAPLVRAGLAHLYFESIHPFEDGNGRIGRAISEKALAQGLGQPSLTALSVMIERRKKAYYQALESAHRDMDVTEWLCWFADTVLEAQRHTQSWIDFLITKAKLLDRLRGKINVRQEKVLLRIMQEGPDGFDGGLSAGNYQTITGTTAATAGRDLASLVELGVLIRTGKLKGTRYWLKTAH